MSKKQKNNAMAIVEFNFVVFIKTKARFGSDVQTRSFSKAMLNYVN